ncbi:hypothetical protein SAMN05421767_13128 [Granulicatella balaenopterae]|uniref:Uncharacterized protein n=1 Tax=Granulicatella balaenopterae TaxID=137733 RepID=A0A1H9MX25_9LACT|nr:hypothetical protein [Granulicatella balaenopterae]SER28254.1 hypothetical protein SAMN05421767_13128 [Granulicatella balaenopterae]
MNSNILSLQNGSDIRGIAIDTEELKANLTTKESRLIVNGLINWVNYTLS